jgi:hypothetical protein
LEALAPGGRDLWLRATIAAPAGEDALGEALDRLDAKGAAELAAALGRRLEDSRPIVRAEAAGALLLAGDARARAVLDAVLADERAGADAREAAIARLADGRLLLVVVDGRQPYHSLGMTLPELAATLRALDAPDAVNLDAGGSTTLVIRGTVVNLPSDEGGERPVSNALLVIR